jgi:predicted phosphodiesterase
MLRAGLLCMTVKYALLSDVHGNLPALEAVLADVDGRADVNATYHLGDLVGYAPWPDEVVATLRARAVPGVAGNYDSTTAVDAPHCGCRYENPRQEELSHRSYEWTRTHVSQATKRWLAGLPFRIDLRPLGGHASGPRLMLVHGNPILNTVYWTADRSDDFCRTMAGHLGARAGDAIAFGHTHLAWHRTVDDIQFVNTGSVGRPKDGDPRAGYVLVDVGGESVEVEFIRVAWDIDRAAAAIRTSDLPDEFAMHLETGGSSMTMSTGQGTAE